MVGPRELPNVLFVHYGDLKTDPESEMRRIAAFCDIEVDEGAWSIVLETVGLDDASRSKGTDDPMAMAFESGAARFFFKGEAGPLASNV